MADTVSYGVWICGQGWLKKAGEQAVVTRIFATLSRETADSAAALWGAGATVRPIDHSLIDLEDVFIERDQKAQAAMPAKKWWKR